MIANKLGRKEERSCMEERTFPAKAEAFTDVIQFLESALEISDCPMKLTVPLTVAVEEMFINIAHYAYPGSDGDMKLLIDAKPGEIFIRFTDSGIPFDPTAKPDPDVTLSVEERKIGGLGIYMAKRAVDSMKYEYKNGQNILSLVKKY